MGKLSLQAKSRMKKKSGNGLPEFLNPKKTEKAEKYRQTPIDFLSTI
jgi:hypothetical protein